MENESIKKEQNDMNEKYKFIMDNISELKSQIKEKDTKIEELIKVNDIITKKVGDLENQIHKKIEKTY